MNNFEKGPANQSENKSDILSADTYLEKIKESPIKELTIEESVEAWSKNRKRIEAKLMNDRTDRQMKEYLENGFVEEVGFFPLKRNEDGTFETNKEKEDLYISDREKGILVQNVPVFDENGDVLGHKYYRVNKEVVDAKKDIKTDIELKYEKESNDEWFYEEQEKEKELQDKVKKGEMVYLGELTFDEYVALRKKGLPYGISEEVAIFDDNKGVVRDKAKYFARLK